MNDSILNAFLQFRAEFLKRGLEPPDVILLKDRRQGLSFLAQVDKATAGMMVRDQQDCAKAVEHADGSIWVECQICGIKVRWPAERLAIPSGGHVWT